VNPVWKQQQEEIQNNEVYTRIDLENHDSLEKHGILQNTGIHKSTGPYFCRCGTEHDINIHAGATSECYLLGVIS
jgi:hypothetical protein